MKPQSESRKSNAELLENFENVPADRQKLVEIAIGVTKQLSDQKLKEIMDALK